MKQIGRKELLSLVKGSCFMASSGGGSYTSGMNLAENFKKSQYYPSGVLNVIDPDHLEIGKLGVMIGYIGSPAKMEEIHYPRGIVNAVRMLEKKLGIKISYIVPPEIGAISMLAACTTAAHLGIPVIDGDGGGRAVPELSMTTFGLYNEQPVSVFLGSEDGDTLQINLEGKVNSASAVEEIVRPVLSLECFAQKAGLAMWVLPGGELNKIIRSRNSISNCISVGVCIEKNDLKELFKQAHAIGYTPTVIAEGSDIRMEMEVGGGFDNGKVFFETKSKQEISVIFKNESMIAWSSGETTPLAVAPDLISYLITFPNEKMPQLVYSNADLAKMEPEPLKAAHIRLVHLKAPAWMWKIESYMQGHCSDSSFSLPNGSSVQQSYQNALRKLGYYGKVCD